MSRSEARRVLAAVLLLVVGASCAADATNGYRLGRTATAEEIAGWNIDVRPDGEGLPAGEGSVADGENLYEAHCAVCHGSFGESNEYMALAGGVGSLGSNAPVRTVGSKLNHATTLFDYINRAMPFPHSKSLKPDEVYAVSAYVLNLNDIVPADFVASRESLPKVEMPNREGFVRFPGLSEVKGTSDVVNLACMSHCEKDVTISGSLPENFVATMYGDITAEFRGLATMNHRAPSAAALPAVASEGPTPLELIQKYGCVACHSPDKAIVGPAFRDVAAKYKDTPDAVAHLHQSLTEGSVGRWGAIPMPPQVAASEADLALLIDWVLRGAPEP